MAKTIKETLLGTLVHGEEILESIRVSRSISQDKIPVDHSVIGGIFRFVPVFR